MEETKFSPIQLNVYLGSVAAAQDRRKAYERAAKALGVTLGHWARVSLDTAAGYEAKAPEPK